jgi:hypothetical protein
VRTRIVNDPRSVSNAGTVVYVFIESALYGIIAFSNCVFITFVYGFLLSFFEQYLYRVHDSFALLSCFASNAEEESFLVFIGLKVIPGESSSSLSSSVCWVLPIPGVVGVRLS